MVVISYGYLDSYVITISIFNIFSQLTIYKFSIKNIPTSFQEII